MATIRDIAKEAGVNPSTVSKALNGSSDINPETEKNIKDIAAGMGYSLDRLRSKKNDTKTVGVVFPELGGHYYGEIFDVFRRNMEKEGYRVIALMTGFDSVDKQLESIQLFVNYHVSGILYLTEDIYNAQRIKPIIEKSSVKLVMITMMNSIDFCDVINVNHELGVRLAIEHLYKMGHKNIAFIGEHNTYTRQNSFCQCMSEFGLEVKPENIIVNGCRFQKCGYQGMQQVLKMPRGERPTACFAAYDDIACGAIKVAQDVGLRIPEDISIIGVDNSRISEYLSVPLSSIYMPIEEVGNAASKNLLRRIKKDTAPYRMILYSPKLVVRDSTMEVKD